MVQSERKKQRVGRFQAAPKSCCTGILVQPTPATSWTPRDASDLPPTLAAATGGKALSVWQLNDGADPGSLLVELMNEARDLGAVVRRRESTSLLTVDGSLVHREKLQVVGRASALEVVLPEGSELWSMSLDGTPSRPLERAGKIYAPLSLANDGTRTIEIVSVQAQVIPDGRTQIALQLAVLNAPVLEHHWQLLLPEGKRYRFASGSLRPRAAVAPEDSGLDLEIGTGAIQGQVRTSAGESLPGVTVTLSDREGTAYTQLTNARGWYFFRGLGSGRYGVRADLDGFGAGELDTRVRAPRTTLVNLQLGLAVEETITVTSEAPLLDERKVQALFEQDAADFRQEAYAKEANAFRPRALQPGGRADQEPGALGSGKVAGVRPLPVQIPERGKVVHLVGVLPEGEPSVRLDVKGVH